MRLQPRQQLLEIWRSTAQTSYVNGKWIWGGRTGTNSISDAEQLLCILRPATELSRFRLERPNETDDSILLADRAVDLVSQALARLGPDERTGVRSPGRFASLRLMFTRALGPIPREWQKIPYSTRLVAMTL